jgi:hypothetical protein
MDNLDTDPSADEIAALIERSPAFDKIQSLSALLSEIPNGRRVILASAFRALGARKWYFEKESAERKFLPDYRTQLDAAKLLLSYSDGLPTQTTLNVNADLGKKSAEVDSEAQFDNALASSPALRDSLRRRLERAESAHKSGQLRRKLPPP